MSTRIFWVGAGTSAQGCVQAVNCAHSTIVSKKQYLKSKQLPSLIYHVWARGCRVLICILGGCDMVYEGVSSAEKILLRCVKKKTGEYLVRGIYPIPISFRCDQHS
ncbi:hypothetical protein BKA67DRAFT_240225 [Truncatella angustata]|uniref:Uncharacterized protein n=1 Tax=Truncatella angustata TaxID=152316 RepID=A0A9P8ZZX3_9PEZI|nr:uncharacterized protein BKA67DRAFT_240225 [Truncatella angustata]KAH6655525.1 hypothetical protein BKA67DRAFT_240225 [Truncatella angustata]